VTDYWAGNRLAHLERTDISAGWGSGSHSGTRIVFVNEVFQFWHDARQNIRSCLDATHKQAMTRELEDAGRTGWGVGLNDDLEEAFQHITNNRGRWTDNYTTNYFGGQNKVFRRGGLVEAPGSVVTFANAVDGKFATLRSAMNDFNQQTQTLDRQLTTSRTDWDTIGTALTQVKNWGERAKPFLWARPRVQARVGTAVSFTNALGNIHSGLTTYTSARRAGFPQGPAAAIGVLRTAVSYVPVLGNYYGGMVDLIPNLRTWFSNLIEQRIRRIDRASRGRP